MLAILPHLWSMELKYYTWPTLGFILFLNLFIYLLWFTAKMKNCANKPIIETQNEKTNIQKQNKSWEKVLSYYPAATSCMGLGNMVLVLTIFIQQINISAVCV